MDAQEAKRLVLERWPDAKSSYHNCGMGSSYWTVEHHGGELGRAYCGAMTDSSVWIDAATRLSPQPETAQGGRCPWRFPSECPDCNPKPDQQAQPQPAESDGFEEWWKNHSNNLLPKGSIIEYNARAAWQARGQSILAQKPEATVSDEDIQLGLDIYEDRPECAEYRAFKDLQTYSQLFKDAEKGQGK